MAQTSLYGIGEWYGRLVEGLSREERKHLAAHATKPLGPTTPECPFRPGERCNKRGGVCTLSRYEVSAGLEGRKSAHTVGDLVTLCPERFREVEKAYRWVGETLLDCPKPLVATQVDFLRYPENRAASSGSGDHEGSVDDAVERAVGRIDCVLVAPPDGDRLHWCALEVQAVYFSGKSMTEDFRSIAEWTDSDLPPPAGRRRPDWRSSGPKRLMPQLQIKVPALRRWGEKMAGLVDNSFYASMSPMDHVDDVSNCDIAWFIVKYVRREGRAELECDRVHLTTLERAVEGLTAGVPLSQSEFEARIRAKLSYPS